MPTVSTPRVAEQKAAARARLERLGRCRHRDHMARPRRASRSTEFLGYGFGKCRRAGDGPCHRRGRGRGGIGPGGRGDQPDAFLRGIRRPAGRQGNDFMGRRNRARHRHLQDAGRHVRSPCRPSPRASWRSAPPCAWTSTGCAAAASAPTIRRRTFFTRRFAMSLATCGPEGLACRARQASFRFLAPARRFGRGADKGRGHRQ